LCEFVKSKLLRRPTAEWQRLLAAADIPVFPVHSFESLMEDEHLRDIGYFREVQHPTVGTFMETAVPSEWHGTPPNAYRLPPVPGEHSAEVLAELGYAPHEIEAMFGTGACARHAKVPIKKSATPTLTPTPTHTPTGDES